MEINELPFTDEELSKPFEVTTDLNGETLLNGKFVPPEKEKHVDELLEMRFPPFRPASAVSGDEELDF